MKNFFNKIFKKNVTHDEARDIVRNSYLPDPECFQVFDEPRPGWQLYNNWGDEPCWYVTMPHESIALQSTRVAVVSKISGNILTIASANDEG